MVIVVPEPVGPIKRTLLFSSSTLSSSSILSGIPDSAPDLVLKSGSLFYYIKTKHDCKRIENRSPTAEI